MYLDKPECFIIWNEGSIKKKENIILKLLFLLSWLHISGHVGAMGVGCSCGSLWVLGKGVYGTLEELKGYNVLCSLNIQ